MGLGDGGEGLTGLGRASHGAQQVEFELEGPIFQSQASLGDQAC